MKLDVQVASPTRAEIGEGPIWDPRDETLLWIDMEPGRIHRFSPARGEDEQLDTGQPIGSIASRASGGLVVAMEEGFACLDDGSSDLRLVAAVEDDDPRTRMNDGKCDRHGRFWAGTASLEPGAGGLYRLDPDYSVTRVLGDVTASNGLDWSPDDRRLYYVDTMSHGLDVFDFDLDGGLIGNRRRLVDIAPADGLPDGLTVDADGCIWLAVWGASEVRRYTPDGRLDRRIELPASQITSCAFGGTDLDVLYVTSAALDVAAAEPEAGALFQVRAGVQGLPPRGFAG